MGTCLEKLLKTTRTPVPEPILGKIALYVSVQDSFFIWDNSLVLVKKNFVHFYPVLKNLFQNDFYALAQ